MPQLSWEQRGDIYMARKMYRDAIDAYRRAPATPVMLNKIGIAFQQMSRMDLAKKYYEQALRLDHEYAEAINNLGTVYYAERSYKKAIVYYKRSLKYSGPTACMYANLGAAYFGRHDYKRASDNYEKAFNLDPDVLDRRDLFGTRIQEHTSTDLAAFHFYLAKTYARRGANDRALTYLRKALEEGLKDRKKLPEVPEFQVLKQEPRFQELLAENPRPL
ncbi:MAG: tetratricopeptide repeat protein [Acidobacteriaceae bacterium]|nr:tetratricopeptide repeat protein [Acidobacteriaceae bacterium]